MKTLKTREKELYRLITDEELEAPTMPDSVFVGKDAEYMYFICGAHKVKVKRD